MQAFLKALLARLRCRQHEDKSTIRKTAILRIATYKKLQKHLFCCARILCAPKTHRARGCETDLQTLRSNQTLNLGHLNSGLLVSTGHLTLHPVLLLQLVGLVKGKKLADASGTLRAKAPRNIGIRKAWQLTLTLLDDHQVKNLDFRGNNAAANALPLPLTLPALAIAGGPLLQKQAHALGSHDTLLHGETLLVVASRDLEDVTLELIAHNISNNLLVHTLIVELAPANEYFHR